MNDERNCLTMTEPHKIPSIPDRPVVIQPNLRQPTRVYLQPIQPCSGCGNPGGRLCRVPGAHCGY
jgi:hypothetical protein